MTSPGPPPAETRPTFWPYIGVGCLTWTVGFFGGGMIAAFVAKVVGSARGCKPPEGFPACDTWSFVLPGAVIGAVGLSAAALRRLRQSRQTGVPGGNS